MPGVVERLNLSVALPAALVLEQHVVAAAAVEGRIEVDQVHRFRWHVFQDGQVIAEEDFVHCNLEGLIYRKDAKCAKNNIIKAKKNNYEF